MDEMDVTNEDVSAEVSGSSSNTGVESSVGQEDSQGALQSPATPAIDPGTGVASEISNDGMSVEMLGFVEVPPADDPEEG